MKTGFITTTFRNIKSLEKVVETAKKAGAQCIEWGADVHVTDLETAKRAKELCDKAGIEVTSYGSYYRVGKSGSEEWIKTCEIARAAGADSIRVWLGSEDSEKTDEETYNKLVSELQSMCDVAAEYGIDICPECHDHTFNNNTDAFLRIRKDVGRENLFTYFQSRYKKKAYDLDRIERTLPYIKHVHVSYFDMRREQFPSYDGNYMNELLQKLISCGFDGNIIVEFTYPGFKAGFAPCLKNDIRRLNKRLGK